MAVLVDDDTQVNDDNISYVVCVFAVYVTVCVVCIPDSFNLSSIIHPSSVYVGCQTPFPNLNNTN